MTPWLKLLGKGAPDPPMVHIFLKRSGNNLKKAKAEVCLAAGASSIMVTCFRLLISRNIYHAEGLCAWPNQHYRARS